MSDDASRRTTLPNEEAKCDAHHNTFFQTRFFKSRLSLYDLGMERLQAFKYKLQPNNEQAHAMCRLAMLSEGSHIKPLNRFRKHQVGISPS
ncbi:MAG: hypothetical protein P8179_08980 [Candidatus Thiodiazotropha sp.]